MTFGPLTSSSVSNVTTFCCYKLSGQCEAVWRLIFCQPIAYWLFCTITVMHHKFGSEIWNWYLTSDTEILTLSKVPLNGNGRGQNFESSIHCSIFSNFRGVIFSGVGRCSFLKQRQKYWAFQKIIQGGKGAQLGIPSYS